MDLDGDGKADVLSGSWPGRITLFKRTADGFAGGETLTHPNGTPVDPANGTHVFAFDWDGDGKPDLVIGTSGGEVLLAPNVGERGKPVFGEAKPLSAGGKPIKIPSGCAAPAVADWDGDGKPDLVVGAGDGSVVWFRNEGKPKAPALAAAAVMVPPSPSPRANDKTRRPGEWGIRARPCVVDWDGDGRPDLLVGDVCGGFEGKPAATAEDRAEEAEAAGRLPALRKEWAAAYRAFADLSDAPEPADPAARDAHRARVARLRTTVARLRDEIGRLEDVRDDHRARYMSHGYVWLFRRLPPAK